MSNAQELTASNFDTTVQEGVTLIKTLEDTNYPRPEGWTKTARHDDNIEEMYRQLVGAH